MSNKKDRTREGEDFKGGCRICGTSQPPLHLDHDHVTGKRRGLLCQWCNPGLGQFQDHPKLLRSATRYIVKSRRRTRVPRVAAERRPC